MSITIKPTRPDGRPCPDREDLGGPCPACAGGYCQPGWCRDGREIVLVCDAPTCDVASAHARVLLATVGIDAGPYLTGAIEPDEVEGILAECVSALGADADGMVRRSSLLADESVDGRRVTHGTDDARACERLARLLAVLEWASEHGAGIAW